MADLVQVVDEWMKFRNQPKPLQDENGIFINEVTFINRNNHTVYAHCRNCNSDITYSDRDYDNYEILVCPHCQMEFYANPITKNKK